MTLVADLDPGDVTDVVAHAIAHSLVAPHALQPLCELVVELPLVVLLDDVEVGAVEVALAPAVDGADRVEHARRLLRDVARQLLHGGAQRFDLTRPDLPPASGQRDAERARPRRER